MIAYAALLGLSLWLNRADRKMLLLSALVGGSFFMEVPRGGPAEFYGVCLTIEVVLAVAALAIGARASLIVAEICLVMVAAHIMGWLTNGYAPLSPYKGIMFITEYAQIAVCILASRSAIERLRN